jgi:hypothetical protein
MTLKLKDEQPPQATVPEVFRLETLDSLNVFEITVDRLQYFYARGLTSVEYVKFCLERIRKVRNIFDEAMYRHNHSSCSQPPLGRSIPRMYHRNESRRFSHCQRTRHRKRTRPHPKHSTWCSSVSKGCGYLETYNSLKLLTMIEYCHEGQNANYCRFMGFIRQYSA